MKLAAALFAAMVAIAAVSFIVGRSGRLAQCTDFAVAEAKSPDGRFVATRFEHECGAASRATTQVALRPSNDPFAPDDRDVVLIAAGRVPVSLRWRDEKTLVVTTGSTILDRRPAWRDVAVVVDRFGDTILNSAPRN